MLTTYTQIPAMNILAMRIILLCMSMLEVCLLHVMMDRQFPLVLYMEQLIAHQTSRNNAWPLTSALTNATNKDSV